MRIAFVVAVFPPELEPASVMAGELVREWSRAGHEVLVICPFPNRPGGKIYPGYSRRPWKRYRVNGSDVLRVWSWLIGSRRRAVSRVLENLSFGLFSALAVLVTRKPDVILMESWPILAQSTVIFAGKIRGVPVINYIKDVYPEAAVAAGVIKPGSFLEGFLTRGDRSVCRRSARNVVISEGMGELIAKRRDLPGERFTVITDWLDLEAIRPFEGHSSWRKEVGIGNQEFVCLFAGTMGLASGVDILLDVAEILRNENGIRLVCVGEGVLKDRMRTVTAEKNLGNLTLLPFQPRERVPEVQSSADVLLLTSSPKMGVSSIPSKLITYLAVGRPVICSVSEDSDLARLVRESGVGLVIKPGCPDSLAGAILKMLSLEKKVLSEMGQRARFISVDRYSLYAAMVRFEKLFSDLLHNAA